MKIARSLDQFGALFKPAIKNQETEHKSVMGGMLTVTIYCSCLAYLIFNLVQWRDGQILPKIISTQSIISNYRTKITDPIVVLQGMSIKPEDRSLDIDPFDPQNMILVPMYQQFVDGIHEEKFQPVHYNTSQKNSGFYEIQVSDLVFEVKYQPEIQSPGIYYFLYLFRCNDGFKASGYMCAPAQLQQQYFSYVGNRILVKTYLQQFDTATKALQRIDKQYLLVLDPSLLVYGQLIFNIADTVMDDAILFSNERVFTYISSSELTTQQLNLLAAQQFFEMEVYCQLSVRLGPVQSIQYVQYQKINELLADVGSIVSIILLLSVFGLRWNELQQRNLVINEIIKIYYPEIKQVHIKRSFLTSKICRVTINNQDIDPEAFSLYYEKLKQTAEKKITVLNQINELARLQFAITDMGGKPSLEKSRNMGIQLKDFSEASLVIQDNSIEQTIMKIQDDPKNSKQPLADSDFDLICIDDNSNL